RIDLESRALRLAMKRLDKAAIRGLKGLLDRAEGAHDDVTDWSAQNWAFHSSLYAAAGRPRLLHMIEGLHGQTERHLQLHLTMLGYRETGEREHRELLKLAAKGDVESAVALLREHIENVYTLLEPYLSRRNAATSLKTLYP
ncbi:MAG: FCD domain-containing protein, partial [Candidatus Baltobacteraceae bacterium]